MKDKIFGVLQRVGRSFMLPIALLPVAGLLLQHISGKTAFAARCDIQRKAVIVQRIIAVLAVYRAGKVVQSAGLDRKSVV